MTTRITNNIEIIFQNFLDGIFPTLSILLLKELNNKWIHISFSCKMFYCSENHEYKPCPIDNRKKDKANQEKK